MGGRENGQSLQRKTGSVCWSMSVSGSGMGHGQKIGMLKSDLTSIRDARTQRAKVSTVRSALRFPVSNLSLRYEEHR